MAIVCPPHMSPVARLATLPVRMTADIEPKTDRDGVQKTSPYFPGCTAWTARVACILGAETIDMPDGTTERSVRTETYTVTVWVTADESAAVREAGRAGSWVRIAGLMAGAVEGTLYMQATGLTPHEKAQAKA